MGLWLGSLQFSKGKVDGTNINPSRAASGGLLVVLTQTPRPGQPAYCTLHYPTFRLNDKANLLAQSSHTLQKTTTAGNAHHPGNQRDSIATIHVNFQKTAQVTKNTQKHQTEAFGVRYIGRRHLSTPEKTQCIYQ